MSITKVGGVASAILAIAAVLAIPYKIFDTKADAAERMEQQDRKPIDLQLQLLNDRIEVLNQKKTLTKQEQQELNIKLAMVQQIMADRVAEQQKKVTK